MTRRIHAFALSWLAFALASGCAPLGMRPLAVELLGRSAPAVPDDAAIAQALEEALQLATRRTVGRTARDGGFRDDSRIRIRLPGELDGMIAALRSVGLGGQMNALELAMNRAAERAAAEGLDVFSAAIEELRFDDPASVLHGPGDAATRSLRDHAGPRISERFTRIVDDTMRQVGLVQAYDQLLARYATLPGFESPRFDPLTYTSRATVDGLFRMLAEEERRIRADPDARSSPLLQEMFGGPPATGGRVSALRLPPACGRTPQS